MNIEDFKKQMMVEEAQNGVVFMRRFLERNHGKGDFSPEEYDWLLCHKSEDIRAMVVFLPNYILTEAQIERLLNDSDGIKFACLLKINAIEKRPLLTVLTSKQVDKLLTSKSEQVVGGMLKLPDLKLTEKQMTRGLASKKDAIVARFVRNESIDMTPGQISFCLSHASQSVRFALMRRADFRAAGQSRDAVELVLKNEKNRDIIKEYEEFGEAWITAWEVAALRGSSDALQTDVGNKKSSKAL